jgi:hypothetical protein
MTAENQTAIELSHASQVGIVVRDVDAVAENYWNILGIGPWVIMTVPPPYMHDRSYAGKPTYFVGRFGFAQLGDFELELLQNVQGPNIYEDYIREQGEGCNHLQDRVASQEELDLHTEYMADRGIGVLQTQRFGDNGALVYFDSVKRLKTIWEPVRWADHFEAPSDACPADAGAVSPAKVKVERISKISFAVKDADEAVESYQELFGVGPWEVVEQTPLVLTGRSYRGAPARHTFKVATASLEAVQIELVQPISGDSLQADFLREQGEGICQLAFEVSDLAAANAALEKEGFSVIQSGVYEGAPYACYDTRGPLKIVWRAHQSAGA